MAVLVLVNDIPYGTAETHDAAWRLMREAQEENHKPTNWLGISPSYTIDVRPMRDTDDITNIPPSKKR